MSSLGFAVEVSEEGKGCAISATDDLTHLFLGLQLCLTIVGIPLGLGKFKLAGVAIAPLGKEIAARRDPRVSTGTI